MLRLLLIVEAKGFIHCHESRSNLRQSIALQALDIKVSV